MQFLTRLTVFASLGVATWIAPSCSTGAGPESADTPIEFMIEEPGRSVFAGADAWTLFALDPSWPDQEADPATLFHGHRILGSTQLTDPATMNRLAAALNAGIRANDGMAAGCFNPRHGISVETPEGPVDLSICFECLQVYVFDRTASAWRRSLTMGEPKTVFNGIYRAAGLEIAQ